MTKQAEKKTVRTFSVARGIVLAAVLIAAFVGIVFHFGWGTLSSFGIGDLALLCPLGGLESMLSSHSIVVHAVVAMVLVGAIALLTGKAFCAWGCPAGLLARSLRRKKYQEAVEEEQRCCGKQAYSAFKAALGEGGADSGLSGEVNAPGRYRFDSRHLVLTGALVSALIFGFPVFCLVCPIGLIFGTMIALVQLVGYNQPSLGLIIFPAILAIELLVLRKWCHSLCPVGALLSLIASLNRTLRPRVDKEKCLRYTQGQACSACSSSCPELVDPHSDLGMRSMIECTRCGKCAEACPQDAISFTRRRWLKEGRQPDADFETAIDCEV